MIELSKLNNLNKVIGKLDKNAVNIKRMLLRIKEKDNFACKTHKNIIDNFYETMKNFSDFHDNLSNNDEIDSNQNSNQNSNLSMELNSKLVSPNSNNESIMDLP